MSKWLKLKDPDHNDLFIKIENISGFWYQSDSLYTHIVGNNFEYVVKCDFEVLSNLILKEMEVLDVQA